MSNNTNTPSQKSKTFINIWTKHLRTINSPLEVEEFILNYKDKNNNTLLKRTAQKKLESLL